MDLVFVIVVIFCKRQVHRQSVQGQDAVAHFSPRGIPTIAVAVAVAVDVVDCTIIVIILSISTIDYLFAMRKPKQKPRNGVVKEIELELVCSRKFFVAFPCRRKYRR